MIKEKLIKAYKRYLKIYMATSMKTSIVGSMEVVKRKNSVQYYHIYYTKEGSRIRNYIDKNNFELAVNLQYKSYHRKLYKLAKKRIKLLAPLLNDFQDNEIDDIYNSLPVERRCLIRPIEPSFEELEEKWFKIPFERLGFRVTDPVILAENGVRVRSKSEKSFADKLTMMGRKFKFECKLVLPNGEVVFPDFTLLSEKTGEEIYIEHLGLMDDPVYFNKTMEKIRKFEENGILLGHRLFLTFGTKDGNFDTKGLERIVELYIKKDA